MIAPKLKAYFDKAMRSYERNLGRFVDKLSQLSAPRNLELRPWGNTLRES